MSQPLPGARTRRLPAAAVGVVVGAGIYAGRWAGLVVGPFAVVLVAVVVLLFPGPRRLADRLLAAAAVVLGWLPLLGWVPGLGTRVDIPGALLAVAAGITVTARARRPRRRPARRATVTAVDLLALAIAQLVTGWWALPFFRHDDVHRFGLLAAAWDHSSHYHFLRENIVLGSFVTSRPGPPGAHVFGWDYPQGIHQAWAQWARLWDPHVGTGPDTLLHVYVVMVLVTAGVAVAVAGLGAARLFHRHDATSAFPLLAAVAQVVAVGVLSIAVWSGYPNFAIAVVCVATVPAVILRPAMSPWAGFVTAAGLMLAAAYNWHPIALLAAAPVLVAVVPLWRSAATPRARLAVFAACACAVVAAAAPVMVTLHLGTDLALAHGGIPPVSRWIVVASALTLTGAGVARGAPGAWTTSLAVGALGMTGLAAVGGVVGYQVSSEGQVLYYGEKLATGVAGACVVGLVLLLGERLARAPRLPVVSSLLVGIAVFQLTGYVGPDWGPVAGDQAATGFRVHEQWMHSPSLADEGLVRLLATANAIRRSDRARWCYVDEDRADPAPVLADTWVASLVGDLDMARVRRAALLDPLHRPDVTTPERAAEVLTDILPRLAVPELRVVVTDQLAAALLARGGPWQAPGLLWVLSHGRVVPVVAH